MNKKESVFISAVIYLSDFANNAEEFTRNLIDSLKAYFDNYEVIIVDDCSSKHKDFLSVFLPSLADNTITVVYMSVKQGIEACLKAGLDVSIGDFVFEFDTLEVQFQKELLWAVYQEALNGNDIVSVEPRNNSFSRRIFYRVFNTFSNAEYKVNASAFRLISRRAINRVVELNMSNAFRQAVYASCGLKNSRIEYKGLASQRKARGFGLAIDSLLLYTDFCRRICAISLVSVLAIVLIGLLGVCFENIAFLYNISILISMTVLIVDITILMYSSNLIMREKNVSYHISNIEKIQKGKRS